MQGPRGQAVGTGAGSPLGGVTRGIDCTDGIAEGGVSSSPPSLSPRMILPISSPVSVSYSSRPCASRSNCSDFSSRIERATS